MLTLLQNVAILGILGLGMAIVVIGRGIDISMIAALAVPRACCCRWCRTATRCPRRRCRARAGAGLRARQRLADRLCRGAVAVHNAGVGPVPRRPRTGRAVSPRRGAMEPAARSLRLVRPRHAGRRADAGRDVRRARCWWRCSCDDPAGAYIYAIGDNPFGARATGLPTRPIMVLEYVLAALIGVFAGIVMAASVNSMPTRIFNSTMIYDVMLVVVLGGIGLSGGRGGVLNVIIGTLLIGTMLNGMTIMDISYSVQNIDQGRGAAGRDPDRLGPQPAQRGNRAAGRHLGRGDRMPGRRATILRQRQETRWHEAQFAKLDWALPARRLRRRRRAGAWRRARDWTNPFATAIRRRSPARRSATSRSRWASTSTQGWFDGLKKELEPSGMKVVVRDPNWNTNAGAQAFTDADRRKAGGDRDPQPRRADLRQADQEGRGRRHLRRPDQHALGQPSTGLRRRRLGRDRREATRRPWSMPARASRTRSRSFRARPPRRPAPTR